MPSNYGAGRVAVEPLCSLLYESPTPDANGDTWIMDADPGITICSDDKPVCPKVWKWLSWCHDHPPRFFISLLIEKRQYLVLEDAVGYRYVSNLQAIHQSQISWRDGCKDVVDLFLHVNSPNTW